MCGIIGFFNFDDAETLAEKGLKNIEYRGRDGINFISQNNCALGHCLHAINNNVQQPFVTNEYVFATNCEIYNWKELDKNLNSRNDAELLFRFVSSSKDLAEDLKKIDGVYAFAYWNKKAGKLYVARDIIGEKPLWYYFDPVNSNFAFASERKALKSAALEDAYIRELNPRHILIYNINDSTLLDIEREFFSVNESREKKESILKKTEELLINAIEKRISPENKVGLLFSGGIDSTFIALVLKKVGIKFRCYTSAVVDKNFKESEDLVWAKKVAKEMELDLSINTISVDEVPLYLKKILPLIEDNNVVKAGVALPFFLAAQKAKNDGVKILYSGLGSEEIFAGYERHKNSSLINEECLSGLRKIYERDLYRDDVITMFHTIELRLPFLDTKLVEYSLTIPSELKIDKSRNKIILREIAKKIGMNEEFVERKKKAAQYGSNFDKAIEKLAKKEKKNKSAYLKQFFDRGNVKIAALMSTGKDSLLATQIMIEQNYKIECFITINSNNKDSYMYHGPNTRLAEFQAEAAQIPLISKTTNGLKEQELKELKEAILEAISEYKIEGIVTGALYSNYQRKRIEIICDELGIKCFSPLWHIDQEKEVQLLLDKGFKFWLVKIAAEGLNETWLGRDFSFQDLEKLKMLNKKIGLNIAGEGGEYESLVLDAPFFRKKLDVKKARLDKESKNTAVLVVEKAVLKEKP